MKDLDRDLGAEGNDPYNKTPFNEVNKSAEAFKNEQEGSQENKKEYQGKGAYYEEKEASASSEGQADREKGGNGSFQSAGAENLNHEYYSSYTPPYYVPNFTVSEPQTVNNTSTSKGKYTAIAVVIGVVIGFLILALAIFNLPKLAGMFFGNGSIDLGGENVTLIQNSPQVEIERNTDSDYIPSSLPEVVSKVGSSVVEITTSSVKSDYFYGQYVTSGAGSGVIVTQSEEAGYLLSNYHVIYDDSGKLADKITVILTNGEEYSAVLVGSDYSTDLALLRIEKKNKEEFTVAAFGDSSKLVVGQEVVAIGNPLGSLGGTVTDGIVSALDRRVKIGNVEMVLLQHNAAINPGNSGGALFDMMGNLIGIVNAKTSQTGIEGLGFAIPSNIAFNFINRVMVLEPAIGIKVKYAQLNRVVGLYVSETTSDSFELYDRIIEISGETIDSAAEYYAIIDCFKIGDEIKFKVVRDGVKKDITVKLGSQ